MIRLAAWDSQVARRYRRQECLSDYRNGFLRILKLPSASFCYYQLKQFIKWVLITVQLYNYIVLLLFLCFLQCNRRMPHPPPTPSPPLSFYAVTLRLSLHQVFLCLISVIAQQENSLWFTLSSGQSASKIKLPSGLSDILIMGGMQSSHDAGGD